jgi:hypothetical protein
LAHPAPNAAMLKMTKAVRTRERIDVNMENHLPRHLRRVSYVQCFPRRSKVGRGEGHELREKGPQV